jgi:ferritin
MRKPLIDKSCTSKIEAAIKYELGHFYLYKHLAICMQAVGYFGAMDYFLAESKEEDDHALKHINFLNDMGVMAKLPSLSPEKEVPTELYEALELAFENEKDLLDYYKSLYREEVLENPEIAEHLNFYIKTQVEAVGFYGDMLSLMESEKDNKNVCMIVDSKLKKLA